MNDESQSPTTDAEQPLTEAELDAVEGGADQGLGHPSLPNYYPVVGGTDFGLS